MRHALAPSCTSTHCESCDHSTGTPFLIALRRAPWPSSGSPSATSAGFLWCASVKISSAYTPTAREPSGLGRNPRFGASGATFVAFFGAPGDADHTPFASAHTSLRSAPVAGEARAGRGHVDGDGLAGAEVDDDRRRPSRTRHSTHRPSSASWAGPSAHGSVRERRRRAVERHPRPRAAEIGEQHLAGGVGAERAHRRPSSGSVAISVSLLPFGSTFMSDAPRAKMIVPPAKSSSARAPARRAATTTTARRRRITSPVRSARSALFVSEVTNRPLPGDLEQHDVAEPREVDLERRARRRPCAPSFSNCGFVSGLPSTNTSDRNSSGAIQLAPSRWILSRIAPVRLSELRTTWSQSRLPSAAATSRSKRSAGNTSTTAPSISCAIETAGPSALLASARAARPCAARPRGFAAARRAVGFAAPAASGARRRARDHRERVPPRRAAAPSSSTCAGPTCRRPRARRRPRASPRRSNVTPDSRARICWSSSSSRRFSYAISFASNSFCDSGVWRRLPSMSTCGSSAHGSRHDPAQVAHAARDEHRVAPACRARTAGRGAPGASGRSRSAPPSRRAGRC